MSLGKAPYDENRRSTLRNGGLHLWCASRYLPMSNRHACMPKQLRRRDTTSDRMRMLATMLVESEVTLLATAVLSNVNLPLDAISGRQEMGGLGDSRDSSSIQTAVPPCRQFSRAFSGCLSSSVFKLMRIPMNASTISPTMPDDDS